MQYPRISTRAWFWGLALALFLWAYAGTRLMPATGPSFLRSTQSNVITAPVSLLLTPGSWLGTLVQRFFMSMANSFSASRAQVETASMLKEENLKMQDMILQRDTQIQALQEDIRTLKSQTIRGIPVGDLVRANITGRGGAAGSSTINIDKGTADGVVAGLPVIAGENHIIGRVLRAGPKEASIRLTTDEQAQVQAVIVRYEGGKSVPLLKEKETCLVKGWRGQLISDTIKTADAKIQKGDVLQLSDKQWPDKLQGYVVGVVEEVRPNEKAILRYEVRGRANINEIQTVDVLIKY